MKTWFPKGKQRIIPTYGKHEGVKLVGFLDYEIGHVYVEEHKKYDVEVFLQFLKNVLTQYPDGKIVIIFDNAKIHHAKLLKEFLKKTGIIWSLSIFHHTVVNMADRYIVRSNRESEYGRYDAILEM